MERLKQAIVLMTRIHKGSTLYCLEDVAPDVLSPSVSYSVCINYNKQATLISQLFDFVDIWQNALKVLIMYHSTMYV